MAKTSGNRPDKNLAGVVNDLEDAPVNSLDAQQRQQDVNDRRRRDNHNHQHKVDMDPSH
ncbi:hypothetical protein [Paenibacillus brevis]|uniref:YfhD family protein n=1 Tax=Paenibacillus brevis TaxID=2841508 RepID=A0ABS6FTH5_9BACL|nr:hypothetical protein [Paenibacillus brevis]MBU5673536.1 hypothetical protein [Paenibacillus brevis]